jgi:hypothetical protein
VAASKTGVADIKGLQAVDVRARKGVGVTWATLARNIPRRNAAFHFVAREHTPDIS